MFSLLPSPLEGGKAEDYGLLGVLVRNTQDKHADIQRHAGGERATWCEEVELSWKSHFSLARKPLNSCILLFFFFLLGERLFSPDTHVTPVSSLGYSHFKLLLTECQTFHFGQYIYATF